MAALPSLRLLDRWSEIDYMRTSSRFCASHSLDTWLYSRTGTLMSRLCCLLSPLARLGALFVPTMNE